MHDFSKNTMQINFKTITSVCNCISSGFVLLNGAPQQASQHLSWLLTRKTSWTSKKEEQKPALIYVSV